MTFVESALQTSSHAVTSSRECSACGSAGSKSREDEELSGPVAYERVRVERKRERVQRREVFAEWRLTRSLLKEAEEKARYAQKPGFFSRLKSRLAQTSARRAERAQVRYAADLIALDEQLRGFDIAGEKKALREELSIAEADPLALNPLETPWRRRWHRGLYAALIPILRGVVKLTYGARVIFEEDADATFADAHSKKSDEAVVSTEYGKRRGALLFPQRDSTRAPYRGVVVTINHCCYLDCVMAACALWPARLRFLSLAENGYGHLWGPIVRALGTIFVGKTLAQTREMLKRQDEALKAGDCLAIYPEGNLRPYELELQPFKRGAFQIAAAHHATIVPVTLVQAPKSGLLKRLMGKPGFEIHVGHPIACPQGVSPHKAATILQQNVRQEMERMLQDGPCEDARRLSALSAQRI